MSDQKSFSEPTETKFNDFESMKFGDLEVDEVFWINDSSIGEQNQIWRKQDMNDSPDGNLNAVNLRTGEGRQFAHQEQVFMRI